MTDTLWLWLALLAVLGLGQHLHRVQRDGPPTHHLGCGGHLHLGPDDGVGGRTLGLQRRLDGIQQAADGPLAALDQAIVHQPGRAHGSAQRHDAVVGA